MKTPQLQTTARVRRITRAVIKKTYDFSHGRKLHRLCACRGGRGPYHAAAFEALERFLGAATRDLLDAELQEACSKLREACRRLRVAVGHSCATGRKLSPARVTLVLSQHRATFFLLRRHRADLSFDVSKWTDLVLTVVALWGNRVSGLSLQTRKRRPSP